LGYHGAIPPMAVWTPPPVAGLPEPVSRVLAEFVEQARVALGETLKAVVLFGSAAENRLRATSDVNVVVVLTVFPRAGLEALRPSLARAHAAVRLEVLWLLDSEVAQAAEAFAVKSSTSRSGTASSSVRTRSRTWSCRDRPPSHACVRCCSTWCCGCARAMRWRPTGRNGSPSVSPMRQVHFASPPPRSWSWRAVHDLRRARR
jgi:predicted nucleotidyltransferase